MPRRDGGYSDLSEFKNPAPIPDAAAIAQPTTPASANTAPATDIQAPGFSIGAQGGGIGGLVVGAVILGVGAAIDALSDKKTAVVAGKAKLPTP